jgi:hypothetical protein
MTISDIKGMKINQSYGGQKHPGVDLTGVCYQARGLQDFSCGKIKFTELEKLLSVFKFTFMSWATFGSCSGMYGAVNNKIFRTYLKFFNEN